MRKLFLLTLALLLVTAVSANAASIPLAVDAQYYPEVWTTSVYNNTTSAMTSGTVVSWDFANSTGTYADQCNWVVLPGTNASHIRTAGVVTSDSIASYGSGDICIRGVVLVRIRETVTADYVAGSSSTYNGYAQNNANDSAAYTYLGIWVNTEAILSTIGENEYCFVNPATVFND